MSCIINDNERKTGCKKVEWSSLILSIDSFSKQFTFPRSASDRAIQRMFTNTIFITLFLCTTVTALITVPFIRNVTFVPLSNTSSFTIYNRTCRECLCVSNASHMVLNCIPNRTCQFFVNASRKFTLQPTQTPSSTFLNKSCPMPVKAACRIPAIC